jgi:hypothetical protein
VRARLTFVLIALAAHPAARAGDAFEIQVYDVETAPRGGVGLEAHLNHHAIDGAPDQTHLTFEPHYGLTDWAELGGYFQTALTTTGDLAYAGTKVRLKLRWPRRVWDQRIGLALNGELSAVPSRFEPDVWGTELRPVIDLRIGRVYAAVNPILTTSLRGDLAGHPEFEPSAKLLFGLRDDVAIGAEAYASLGPLDDLGRDRGEAAFGVVELRASAWDLHLAAGWGWGEPDHTIAKLIFGFHPGE